MLFSILGLEVLGVKRTDIEICFAKWFELSRPDLLSEKGKAMWAQPKLAEAIRTMGSVTKKEFYGVFMVLIKKQAQLASHGRKMAPALMGSGYQPAPRIYGE